VYLDVGHPRWISHFVISKTLKRVYNFYGISINVSNFVPTEECIRYGTSIGKPFVIDTSRNGAEYSDAGWCNPPNKRLGELPKIVEGHLLLEAFLWIKVPGESDGKENGGPKAGVFWPSYAKELLNDKKTGD
jgi:endoglucanase